MSNPIPQGKYKPAVRKGNLIFTAGMTPRLNGQLIMSGKVESGVSVEDYRQAADQATANALNAALSCVQPGEKITQILSLTVYINAAPLRWLQSRDRQFQRLWKPGINPKNGRLSFESLPFFAVQGADYSAQAMNWTSTGALPGRVPIPMAARAPMPASPSFS